MDNLYLDAFEKLNSLYGAFRLAHWNVVGDNFYSLHLLFQRVYLMLGAQIDPFAEQIRGTGEEISAEHLNRTPEIDWENGSALVASLLNEVEDYVETLGGARERAEKDNNIGFLAAIETLLSEANTIKYLLKSSAN